jgi:acetyl-CoA C-acetyltransferase
VKTSRNPVLVGVGQVTATTDLGREDISPLQLMHQAAALASIDCGSRQEVLREVDSVAVIRLFADTVPRFASPFGKLVNAPWSLARRIGASKATDLVYPPAGGDSPMAMLTRACDRIQKGQSRAALVVGGEALRTELAARRAGVALQWGEDAPFEPDTLGVASPMFTEVEERHGMRSAIAMYALIGQVLRSNAGQTVAAYRENCGRLFEGFAAVARANPLATRRDGFSAARIAQPDDDNPYIGFPYTRLMTSSAYIDQSAAILVVSEELADELAIDAGKRAYLHGEGHAHEEWFISDRLRLDRSLALRAASSQALAQAGKSIDDMAYLDIYSCFPSAVQVACAELGISTHDGRGLTVTGGLPYFGGPGNNYVTHSIAEMVQRVRARPGSYGLVTANGGLLTKEAVGVFSAERPRQPFAPADAGTAQREIDALPKVRFAAEPRGEAAIETYSVLHGRRGPETGVLLGRLLATDERFVANTPFDGKTLARLVETDAMGLRGTVLQSEGRNIFTPDFA